MSFKAGDVCVIVEANCVFNERWLIGMQVTIDALMYIQSNGREFYSVKELHPHWFADNELRKIDPPSKDDAEPRSDFTPGEWDLIPWQPQKVKA